MNAVSCSPYIQISNTHTSPALGPSWRLIYWRVFVLFHSMLAKTGKSTVVGARLTTFRRFPVPLNSSFFLKSSLPLTSPLCFSSHHVPRIFLSSTYYFLSSHCHALSCIFVCVLIHFCTCIIDNKFSFILFERNKD